MGNGFVVFSKQSVRMVQVVCKHVGSYILYHVCTSLSTKVVLMSSKLLSIYHSLHRMKGFLSQALLSSLWNES